MAKCNILKDEKGVLRIHDIDCDKIFYQLVHYWHLKCSKEICMQQPNDHIQPCKEQVFCRLRKPLHDLQHAGTKAYMTRHEKTWLIYTEYTYLY